MAVNSDFNDVLEEIALRVHELIQKPKYLQRFQEQLLAFNNKIERDREDHQKLALENPCLRNRKNDPPCSEQVCFLWDKKEFCPTNTDLEWESDKNLIDHDGLKGGYWRPVNFPDRLVALIDDSPVSPFADKNEELAFSYALTESVHDYVYPEMPINTDFWDCWGTTINGCYIDGRSKRYFKFYLSNVEYDLKLIMVASPPETSAETGQAKAEQNKGNNEQQLRNANNEITDRQRYILQALHENKAFDRGNLMTTAEVAKEAEGPEANPENFKEPMSDLSYQRLIETKTGRGGGAWLTEEGIKLTEHITSKS